MACYPGASSQWIKIHWYHIGIIIETVNHLAGGDTTILLGCIVAVKTTARKDAELSWWLRGDDTIICNFQVASENISDGAFPLVRMEIDRRRKCVNGGAIGRRDCLFGQQ